MNKEYFKILKEISSLENARDKLLYENSEETARVDKLRQRQADEDLERTTLKENLKEI